MILSIVSQSNPWLRARISILLSYDVFNGDNVKDGSDSFDLELKELIYRSDTEERDKSCSGCNIEPFSDLGDPLSCLDFFFAFLTTSWALDMLASISCESSPGESMLEISPKDVWSSFLFMNCGGIDLSSLSPSIIFPKARL
jgi:hypothetical protein